MLDRPAIDKGSTSAYFFSGRVSQINDILE